MIDRTLPYYKWFWQDWRANRKIQRMSYIERGLYRELLDECWVEGAIPNDLKELADICGCPDEVMADAWQVLSSCFVLIDGVLVNEKLHSLRTEKDVERLKKAENGKKGGIAKAIGKQVPSNCHIEEKRREDKKREKNTIPTPEGVSVDLWNDFMIYRKRLKAPVTDRVLARLIKEADLAKMPLSDVLETIIFKGWRSFEASWIQQAQQKAKELPLGTNEQIEQAYRLECGKDPALARFNSYFDMRDYIVKFREERAKA
jgi:uncharacterized protein YdaU (DUF1376 family)